MLRHLICWNINLAQVGHELHFLSTLCKESDKAHDEMAQSSVCNEQQKVLKYIQEGESKVTPIFYLFELIHFVRTNEQGNLQNH